MVTLPCGGLIMILRRFVATILVVCVTIGSFFAIKPVDTLAYSSINTTNKDYSVLENISNPLLKQKLTNVFNGNVRLFSDVPNTYPIGGKIDDDLHYLYGTDYPVGHQCYAYAHGLYYYLFGDIVVFGDDILNTMKHSHEAIGECEEVSYDQFRIANILPGSYIRTTSRKPLYTQEEIRKNPGHSMIVLDYDQYGLTVVSGNADGWGTIYIETYTWDEFNTYQLERSEGMERNILSIVTPDLDLYSDVEDPMAQNIEISNISNSGFSITCDLVDNVGAFSGKVAIVNSKGEYVSDYIKLEYDVFTKNYKARVNFTKPSDTDESYYAQIISYDYIGNVGKTNSEELNVPTYLTATDPVYQAPANYGFYDGHLYIYYKDIDNRLTAERYASKIGGYLVNISSDEENEFVYGIIEEVNGDGAFIGLSYSDQSYSWTWSSKEIIDYDNYADDPGDGLYAAILSDSNGKWINTDGTGNSFDRSIGFIVEMRSFDYEIIATSEFNGNKYIICHKKVPYDQAQMYAALNGGHLVNISSEEENKFVYDFIYSNVSSSSTYIGKPDSDYTNWVDYAGNDNGIEMVLNGGDIGKWRTGTSNWTSDILADYFVIEIDAKEDPITPDIPVTPEDPVEAFVRRLYTSALGREADEEGVITWTNELKNGKTAYEVASGFFFSKEFVDSNVSDINYVTRLYKTFMNREPDEDGLKTWLNELIKNSNRAEVFNGFAYSDEWLAICEDYGIESGKPAGPADDIEPSQGVISFVERLYEIVLGRDGDAAGIKEWTTILTKKTMSGSEVASGFFLSDEFISLNVGDAEYVIILYRTFMDRNPDLMGFHTWMNVLDDGGSRQDVFNGFANSTEWMTICGEFGINP